MSPTSIDMRFYTLSTWVSLFSYHSKNKKKKSILVLIWLSSGRMSTFWLTACRNYMIYCIIIEVSYSCLFKTVSWGACCVCQVLLTKTMPMPYMEESAHLLHWYFRCWHNWMNSLELSSWISHFHIECCRGMIWFIRIQGGILVLVLTVLFQLRIQGSYALAKVVIIILYTICFSCSVDFYIWYFSCSYSTLPHGMSGTPLPYYQQLGTGYTAGISCILYLLLSCDIELLKNLVTWVFLDTSGMPYGYGTASRSGEPQVFAFYIIINNFLLHLKLGHGTLDDTRIKFGIL